MQPPGCLLKRLASTGGVGLVPAPLNFIDLPGRAEQAVCPLCTRGQGECLREPGDRSQRGGGLTQWGYFWSWAVLCSRPRVPAA